MNYHPPKDPLFFHPAGNPPTSEQRRLHALHVAQRDAQRAAQPERLRRLHDCAARADPAGLLTAVLLRHHYSAAGRCTLLDPALLAAWRLDGTWMALAYAPPAVRGALPEQAVHTALAYVADLLTARPEPVDAPKRRRGAAPGPIPGLPPGEGRLLADLVVGTYLVAPQTTPAADTDGTIDWLLVRCLGAHESAPVAPPAGTTAPPSPAPTPPPPPAPEPVPEPEPAPVAYPPHVRPPLPPPPTPYRRRTRLDPETVMGWLDPADLAQGVYAWQDTRDGIIVSLLIERRPYPTPEQRDAAHRRIWRSLLDPQNTPGHVAEVEGVADDSRYGEPEHLLTDPDDTAHLARFLRVHGTTTVVPRGPRTPATATVERPRVLPPLPPLDLAPPDPQTIGQAEQQARRRTAENGWEPVAPWPGSSTLPWQRRCLACGFTVNLPSSGIHLGRCRHPYLDEEEAALALAASRGWTPAAPWPGSPTVPWDLVCTHCGATRSPKVSVARPSTLKPCTEDHNTPPATAPAGPAPRARWILPPTQ
ncbi:hypothetical protein [Kitasatospora sp. NPDC088134]|uniref:hypothetical protein n=1 Tax=Kitasatospora sp. NPDC088134 TaxID=3364071 RepID=UPI00381BFE85